MAFFNLDNGLIKAFQSAPLVVNGSSADPILSHFWGGNLWEATWTTPNLYAPHYQSLGTTTVSSLTLTKNGASNLTRDLHYHSGFRAYLSGNAHKPVIFHQQYLYYIQMRLDAAMDWYADLYRYNLETSVETLLSTKAIETRGTDDNVYKGGSAAIGYDPVEDKFYIQCGATCAGTSSFNTLTVHQLTNAFVEDHRVVYAQNTGALRTGAQGISPYNGIIYTGYTYTFDYNARISYLNGTETDMTFSTLNGQNYLTLPYTSGTYKWAKFGPYGFVSRYDEENLSTRVDSGRSWLISGNTNVRRQISIVYGNASYWYIICINGTTAALLKLNRAADSFSQLATRTISANAEYYQRFMDGPDPLLIIGGAYPKTVVFGCSRAHYVMTLPWGESI